jgi:hypothetical protein
MWTCQKGGVKEKMCGRVENNTCIINPPHYLTWKCQKLSQFSNSWILASSTAPKEYHQHQIVAYYALASSKEMTFLYS